MKERMIIKCNSQISYESEQQLINKLIYQWNAEEGVIIIPPNVEVQAILYQDLTGEIKVINLVQKDRQNILSKILKTIFHSKNH